MFGEPWRGWPCREFSICLCPSVGGSFGRSVRLFEALIVFYCAKLTVAQSLCMGWRIGDWILLRYFWNTSEVLLEYFLGYFQVTFRVLLWYLWDTFGTLLRYFLYTFGILLVYFLDTFETLLGYFWNTFGICLGCFFWIFLRHFF